MIVELGVRWFSLPTYLMVFLPYGAPSGLVIFLEEVADVEKGYSWFYSRRCGLHPRYGLF